jgi:hypothetical protein
MRSGAAFAVPIVTPVSASTAAIAGSASPVPSMRLSHCRRLILPSCSACAQCRI